MSHVSKGGEDLTSVYSKFIKDRAEIEREYAKNLRTCCDEGMGDEELQATILKMMAEIYKIVGICLGIPPAQFKWDYMDKSKQHQSVGPISPLEFYEKYVKPVWNIENKVCLVR